MINKENFKLDWKKIVRNTVIFLIVFYLLSFFVLRVAAFYKEVSSNWDIIRFAMDKPTLVRSIKINYDQKVREVEEQITKSEKTAQDKILEEVVKQFESGKK